MVLINVYAPHGGYDEEHRRGFYEALAEFWLTVRPHGPTIALGDFNARLFRRCPGEENVLGPFMFKKDDAQIVAGKNRELLLEICSALDACVANTFMDDDAS